MAVTCKNCGGAHAIWDCKRPAMKSTATKVVRNRSGTAGSTPAPSTTKGGMGKSEARPSAGKQSNPLQALPVDTNSLPISKANVPTLGIDVGIGGDTNSKVDAAPVSGVDTCTTSAGTVGNEWGVLVWNLCRGDGDSLQCACNAN